MFCVVIPPGVLVAQQGKSPTLPEVTISGPTVIAFWEVPPSDSVLVADPMLASALDQQQYYWAGTRDGLTDLGVMALDQPGRHFRVRDEVRDQLFVAPPDSAVVGYLLVAPGRAFRAIYRVQQPEDLLAAVRSFFGLRDPDGNRLQVFQGWQAPPSWTEAIDPFRIADGLYYVGTAGLASYLVTSEGGHVLIDAPMRENTQMVLANIRRLGFEPGDVRLQLATHAHFDHVGGIAGMLDVTGSDLVLSEHDAAVVADGGGPRALAPYPPAQANRVIGHLETVSAGDRTLTAHLTPGHTRGCTSWSGVVEIGVNPLTFVLVCSLTVLPDYRLVGEDETYPGIARDYCSSVTHLRTLEPDIFLANHGGFMGLADKIRALAAGDEEAFVDPERYKAYLDRAEAAIEQTLGEQGHDGGCSAILEGGSIAP
jgi:metallo-beta-lactamase class B